MIEINLLPEELRRQQKRAENIQVEVSKLPLKLIIITALALFIALQVLSAITLLFKNTSLKRLNQRIEKLEPDYKKAQSLKQNIQQLNNRLSAVNELTSKSILWSKKMSDLSSAITEGIWVRELSLEYARGTKDQEVMILKGSAISRPEGEEAATIGNFINSLKSNKGFFQDFQDIKLESSQIKKIADLQVMDFSIVCYFKSGRSYFDKSKR